MLGVFRLVLYGLALLFCSLLLLPAIVLQLFLPKIAHKIYDRVPYIWVYLNRKINPTPIEAHLPEGLNKQTFYLVTANHQSWADILILYQVFQPHIPLLKFFMKKQLKWVPFVGQLPQLYGFPFLHRHTQAELKKHPEWKKRDFEATKKACERFKHEPGSLMIFAEGTRFTKHKHDKQQSPYQYLLKPKAGGLAFALQCMDDKIQNFIDITIIYPKNHHSFWDYCNGNISKIIVKSRLIPLENNHRGDYENDANYKQQFQQFLNQIWMEKDQCLKDHLTP